MSKYINQKNMIMVGAAVSAVSLAIMAASSASASSIAKSKACEKYPEGVHSLTTAVAVVSSVALVGGIGMVGYGIFKKLKKPSQFSFAF